MSANASNCSVMVFFYDFCLIVFHQSLKMFCIYDDIYIALYKNDKFVNSKILCFNHFLASIFIVPYFEQKWCSKAAGCNDYYR
jgi:hypothetical protein